MISQSTDNSYTTARAARRAANLFTFACIAVTAAAQTQWSASYTNSTPTFGNSSAVLDNGVIVVGDPGFTTGGNRVGQVQLLSPGNPAAVATFNGTTHYADFGAWVGQVGDVNNDGTNDWVIGEPGMNRVWVRSGLPPFGLAFAAPLVPPGGFGVQGFGTRAISVGDLNGDNFDDLAISATSSSPSGQGYIFVFTSQSALSMTYRYSLTITNGAGTAHGITDLGADMDFDQASNTLVAGAPQYLRANSTYFYEGAVASFQLNATGVGLPAPVIVQLPAPKPDRFGTGVACLGDLDNDGQTEWVAGANLRANTSAGTTGLLAYYNTAGGGSLSYYTSSGSNQLRIGFHVRTIEDVDSDGFADVVSNDVFGNAHVISSRSPHATIQSITGYRQTQIGTGPNLVNFFGVGGSSLMLSGVSGSTAFADLVFVAGSMSRGGGCATQGGAPILTCERPIQTAATFRLDVTSNNPQHASQLGFLVIGTTMFNYGTIPAPFCSGSIYVAGGTGLAFFTNQAGAYPQFIPVNGLPLGFSTPIQAGVINSTTGLFDITNGVFVTIGEI